MADRFTVVPAELRQAARDHRDTAEYLNGVPQNHPDILASLDSLGPIFADLRDAGRGLLEQRRACYEQQAAAHAELADKLRDAAEVWEQQDADAARRLGGVAEGGP
jgi:hypothetical protein